MEDEGRVESLIGVSRRRRERDRQIRREVDRRMMRNVAGREGSLEEDGRGVSRSHASFTEEQFGVSR